MSSVGFVPGAVKELETLREAWKTLNDLLKNLANAEACLQKHDLQAHCGSPKGCEVERRASEESNRGSGPR